MSHVSDLVDEERTAWAACDRPTLNIGGEHEVVKNELAPSIEHVEKGCLPGRALELVVLFDQNHRLPAPLGRQRVASTCGVFFLRKQLFMRCMPLRGPLP